MTRAGFWRRVLAFVIDYALIGACAFGAAHAVAPYLTVDQFERVENGLLAATWVVYFTVEIFFGAALGKMAAGIHIRLPDGSAPSRWALFMRYSTKCFGMYLGVAAAVTGNPAAHLLSGMAMLLVQLGFLRALGEDRQAWHDIWSRTAVYRREPRTAPGFPVEPVAPPSAPGVPVGAPPPL